MIIAGMFFNLYFTFREIHKLMMLRAQEIAAVEANNETHQNAITAQQVAAGDKKKLNTEGKKFKAANSALGAMASRRMSFSVESGSDSESDQEVEDVEAEEESEGAKEFKYLYAVQKMGRTFDFENISYLITVHLGFAVAWRKNVFNWLGLGAIITSWYTLVNILFEYVYDTEITVEKAEIDIYFHVVTSTFLWMRLLGFLKGTGIKFATFILMIEEIVFNIKTFLVVLICMLFMFAMLYHILLADKNVDDDGWDLYGTSIWKVWGYSLGEFDDSAFPTTDAAVIFTAFAVAIIIVMMNVLIAIVSDSYADAMRRSVPLFWRARVDLIAEYEPLLPRMRNEVKANAVELTDKQKIEKGLLEPKTWQYRCLVFQEGLIATGIVCGVVLFELLYIGSMPDDDETYGKKFVFGLGVSIFFFAELTFRFYNWRVSYSKESRVLVGGFICNTFRLLDLILVVVDVFMLLSSFALSQVGGTDGSTKATVKLARSLRFARSARWLRGMKVLRSCRFVARLVNRWRRHARPTRRTLLAALTNGFETLEETKSWAGRSDDPIKIMKHDVDRGAHLVMERFEKGKAAQLSAIEAHFASLREAVKGDIQETLSAFEAKLQQRQMEAGSKAAESKAAEQKTEPEPGLEPKTVPGGYLWS
mmetsp:Transcript_18900/g.42955  ORF Transcript_18900/g.42955 Transcript_18900/m.42955 type:complete len:647 (+) Transcript_18900:443-2383(+)